MALRLCNDMDSKLSHDRGQPGLWQIIIRLEKKGGGPGVATKRNET